MYIWHMVYNIIKTIKINIFIILNGIIFHTILFKSKLKIKFDFKLNPKSALNIILMQKRSILYMFLFN